MVVKVQNIVRTYEKFYVHFGYAHAGLCNQCAFQINAGLCTDMFYAAFPLMTQVVKTKAVQVMITPISLRDVQNSAGRGAIGQQGCIFLLTAKEMRLYSLREKHSSQVDNIPNLRTRAFPFQSLPSPFRHSTNSQFTNLPIYHLPIYHLPIHVLLVSPFNQHPARDFLEDFLVARGEQTLPISSLSFWQKG